MRCANCGSEVVEGSVFCHKCGERVELPGGDPAGDDPAGDGATMDKTSSGRGHAAAEAPASTPLEKFRAMAATHQGVADESEKVLWQGHYSSKAMIGRWVLSGLLTIGVVALAIWLRQYPYVAWGAAAAVLLLWLYQVAVLAFRRMNVRYRLTTIRFVHERGILRRVTDRIETIDMTDITFEQGLIERLVGVGTIRILSSDRSDPDLVMPGIDNVKADFHADRRNPLHRASPPGSADRQHLNEMRWDFDRLCRRS